MLILDLGLYPQDSAFRVALDAIEPGTDTETLVIDPGAMPAEEWDGLLEKIMAADKCLTL
jgi:hypothetical protein